MKRVIFAANNNELFMALKQVGQFEIRNIPFLDNLVQIVTEHSAQVVIFDPCLVSENKSVDPKAMLYNVAMMNEAPQIIFLAGNLDKKDELIQFALSCDVRDIVFNPNSKPNEDITYDMQQEIMDRIERPRKLRDVYAELGIKNIKQLPLSPLENIQQIDEVEAGRPVQTDAFPYVKDEQVALPQKPVVKNQRPYLVGVISPASSGATFIASNVAATMAYEGVKTALVDWCSKRTLHYWLGRDEKNRSFQNLFEYKKLQNEETRVNYLDAFTSVRGEMFFGDEDWFNTLERLSYDLVVLDFSSGDAWRRELLLRALDRCDEVLFVSDMDYAKSLQSRQMLEEISRTSGQLRLVLNKWDEDYLPCDLENLAPPLPNPLFVPVCFDIYRAIVQAKPLVAIRPDLRKYFALRNVERSVRV